jgi:hypothetical protein
LDFDLWPYHPVTDTNWKCPAVLVTPIFIWNTSTRIYWPYILLIYRGSHIRLAMALALYEKYLKLSPSWKLESTINDEKKVIIFDGPRTACTVRIVEPCNNLLLAVTFGNNTSLQNRSQFWLIEHCIYTV